MNSFQADFLATIPKLIGTPTLTGRNIPPRTLQPGVDFDRPPTTETGKVVFDLPEVGGEITLAVTCPGSPGNSISRFISTYEQTQSNARVNLKVGHFVPAGDFFREILEGMETNWLIWAASTTWFRRTDWLHALVQAISTLPQEERIGVVGAKLCHTLKAGGRDPRDWFKKAPWYRGKDFLVEGAVEAPNGNTIHYPDPGFFAINKEAAKICQILDPRVKDEGLAIVIGEQLHQNDFKIKSFDAKRQYVVTDNSLYKPTGHFPWQG
jgi:hypothetical protein